MGQRVTKVRKKTSTGFSEAIPIGAKAEDVTLEDGTILQDVIDQLQTGNAGHVDLTQAEYNALSQTEKNNGTVYFVTNSTSAGSINAAAVSYNNTSSGLDATNVQSAINELKTAIDEGTGSDLTYIVISTQS